ncbi:ImmA/IrrE family metallo-endopeptidase [Jatrophihabitans sp.]|uniref:ImmA/IrrE family metallo-endopeptidase n=1 Tax=Jatrophihabitans sp. TaxID=1932789 RepID=UPI0030C6CBAA
MRAAWIRRERVILIDAALNKIERRCALAHEIAHIDAGDRSTPLCWFDRRQENRADILAARRLIDLESLVAVYRLTDNILEAAAELEVTLDVMVLRAGTLRAPEKIALVNARARHEVVA